MYFKVIFSTVLQVFVILNAICLSSSENIEEKKYNKFIRHIFNKYGSKGVINFEVIIFKKKISNDAIQIYLTLSLQK